MLPRAKSYVVYPSVYPADKESRVYIAPKEPAFMLFDDVEYTVNINGVNDDVPDRYKPDHVRSMTLRATEGVISFNYIFEDEQEHFITLYMGEKRLARFSVYSLYDDLYELTPLRGDLHVHSYRSDGTRDPAALFGYYREQGYDFATLSDHNRYYPGGEIDEAYADVKLGITHIHGEEIHIPETPVHIVHVGGNASIAEIYIENSEEYRAEVKEYRAAVPANIPERYAERYALAKWVADKAHQFGGLSIFPHPCWVPGNSNAHNVNDELAMIFLRSGIFDAFEVMGGLNAAACNRQVAMWCDARAEGHDIKVVGSSDVHDLSDVRCFPQHFTICFARTNSESDIIDAVRRGYSVATEGQGEEYSRLYRSYGSFRLVSYAKFLLENYFPELQRICQCEGVAMIDYAIGKCSKELIECQVANTERYKNEFFGRVAPILPGKRIYDTENRWRERHLQGPATKGSTINTDKVTRQI